MSGDRSYRPTIAMVGLQFLYAGIAPFTEAAFSQGMRPPVFGAYRLVIGTLIMMSSVFCLSKRSHCRLRNQLNLKCFSLIFVAVLFGITAQQNGYFNGLYYSSTTAATAMLNLIPAITFVLAAIVGQEHVDIRSVNSIAKITGTIICVGGALLMALVKGPKLLNASLLVLTRTSELKIVGNWLLGCLLLLGSGCCWSFLYILQAPVKQHCPDPLLSSALTCFFGMLQSTIFALIIEGNNRKSWKLRSPFEYGCCIFAGFTSAIQYFLQAWCTSQRGPLFSAMFNPLCTVCGAVFASLFLHEEIYVGTCIGAFPVIVGLYVVLWGKAKDLEDKNNEALSMTVDSETGFDIAKPLDKNCSDDLTEKLPPRDSS